MNERTQSAIDAQVHNDRAANGGTLTGQEKQQIHGEQNAASAQIYNERHNATTITPNAVDNREANQQQRQTLARDFARVKRLRTHSHNRSDESGSISTPRIG